MSSVQPSNPKLGISVFNSDLTEAQLESIKNYYKILNGFRASIPEEDCTIDDPLDGMTGIYAKFPYVGLRFPISLFFLEVLNRYGVSMSQVSPHFVARVLGYELLSKALVVEPPFYEMSYFFIFTPSGDWYTLSRRFKERGIIKGVSDGFKGWGNGFLFVRDSVIEGNMEWRVPDQPIKDVAKIPKASNLVIRAYLGHSVFGKVLPEAALIYYGMSNLGDPEEGSSSADSIAESDSPNEEMEEPITEGSSKRLKMIDTVPDIEILSTTEVLALKVLAAEDVLKEKREGKRPVATVPTNRVNEGSSTILGDLVMSPVMAAWRIEPFRPDFQVVHFGSILNSSHLWKDWFANMSPQLIRIIFLPFRMRVWLKELLLLLWRVFIEIWRSLDWWSYGLLLCSRKTANLCVTLVCKLDEHRITSLAYEEKLKALEMKATESEESCSVLPKELEDAQDELKVAKDELDVVQVEFGEKGCEVGRCFCSDSRGEQESHQGAGNAHDRHLLITESIPYYFSEGLADFVFQRQFKRGVKLEETPFCNPNAITKAQEATVALHHLALDYHRVLADNAQNPTPTLMGIRAKHLLPNPKASTSHTVTGQGSFGAGDREGEANQAKAS
ncbi:OLC1v1001507C1 [Oldenlandia corymbosa var. corymbosa]|uniref:OLC1v1001507C1 n=1 Tax=Oldenlandia corymbosa var. corymbosa TaxID=529605 RepID=A0AAV1D5F0_OLDCO|nr:OLC1v1001507C1 [Oldenlandia corymbosa var. corymbosa]